MTPFETLVLGASGYAGGECLRLVQGHPGLTLKAAVSASKAGATVGSLFPHLASTVDARFRPPSEIPAILGECEGTVAVISAASHGASAPLIAELLAAAEKKGVAVRVVDLSADFRYRDASSYEAVYKNGHGAPSILPLFYSGVPEHVETVPQHAGHPGCFATSVLLAVVPLLKLGISESEIFASGITGSTGSGREPKETTHHPERHSNLFAYQPLVHRHVPEMTELTEKASGLRPKIHFVPHSGPFARGIHTTIQGTLRARLDAEAIRTELARFYAASPLVRVVPGTPRVKDVAGSCYAHLGVATEGDTVAVFSVIDNLLKGAAGGGVQWLNRMLGFPESMGLTAPAPGWI
jgi:N-acetyl-gamma-glutamyl-phosphate reductase